MTRKFDLLTPAEQEMLLFCCAYLSWCDIKVGLTISEHQLDTALEYGSEYEITVTDYAAVDTVFPTLGEPKPPKR